MLCLNLPFWAAVLMLGGITIVYDVLGKIVSTLVDEKLRAGNYTAAFDGRNLASGTYFYILRSGPYIMKRKMMLLK